MAPKETCEGSGTSRKADAGASEASRRGQFFFWRNSSLIPDDEFLRAFFGLTVANNTPLRHWSREAMFGPEARAAWQDPDLVALPF
jgi:hypothetical protein